jgi:predicted nucleotide-binding protein
MLGNALTPEQILAEIERYDSRMSGILSRFEGANLESMSIASTDGGTCDQLVLEIADLFTDALGPNAYTTNIMNLYNGGIQHFERTPSFRSVEQILAVIRAAHTRFARNPEILEKKRAEEFLRRKENVFIIHGRDEAKWRELKDLVQNTFRLNPIILNEQPNFGKTIIEKFEHYAETCNYAIALFTPDDEVHVNDAIYLQARPNVIYELGWFCGRLKRPSVMLLLKQETSMFSDFGGIVQKRFKTDISEAEGEIRKELTAAGLLE